MDRLHHIVEWLDREWLRFLVWFLAGLFIIPIGVSQFIGAVKLDQFYHGLLPGRLDATLLLLVMGPYLLYLGFRIVRHLRSGGEIELF